MWSLLIFSGGEVLILTHQARRSFRSAEFPRATRRRCASEGNGRSRQDAVEQASEEGLVVVSS